MEGVRTKNRDTVFERVRKRCEVIKLQQIKTEGMNRCRWLFYSCIALEDVSENGTDHHLFRLALYGIII